MAYIGKEPGSGLRGRFVYTATAGQTSFTGSDSLGRTLTYTDSEYTDVFLNGVKLDKTDYTATSGTSIVLDSGASADDTLEILAFDTFGLFSGEFAQDVSVGGDLTVDTNTLHVDSANNRVGVGTTSPENPIEIETTNKLGSTFTGTTDGEGLRVTQTDYTAGNYVSLVEAPFDDSQTAANVRIAGMFDGGGSNLAFGTSNSYGSGITNTAMFIHSSGNVQLSGGLSFAGNDAETAANALDDYEEGTWTPVYQALTSNPTVTHSVQLGRYVKVGQFVNVMFRIQTSAASGGSGALVIGGLPFVSTNVSSLFASGPVGFSSAFTNFAPQTLLVGANGTQIQLIRNSGTNGYDQLGTSVTTGELNNASGANDVIGALSYRTD